jgi:CBS domain-containing protein
MTRHRTTRARVSNPPTPDNLATDCECPDLDATLYVTTDSLGKADAFITAAERLIEDHGVGIESADEDDHDPGRIRNNLAHLIESIKLAIREGQYAHGQTVAAFAAHRAESEPTSEVAPCHRRARGAAMIAAVADVDLPMIRVIAYPVDEKPRVTWIPQDPGGGHRATLERLLAAPVARVPLHDGIEVCIHRDGLLAGIALARDVLGAPRVESPRDDLGISFPEDPASNLTAQEWPVSADILLVRVDGGQLVDLTDADVRFMMFWLGLDWIRRH